MGKVIRDLDGVRLTKDSAINPDVAVDRLAKLGEVVKTRTVLAQVHAPSRPLAMSARERLRAVFENFPKGIAYKPVDFRGCEPDEINSVCREGSGNGRRVSG